MAKESKEQRERQEEMTWEEKWSERGKWGRNGVRRRVKCTEREAEVEQV